MSQNITDFKKIKVKVICLQIEWREDGSPIYFPVIGRSVIQVASILWPYH